MSVEMDDAEGAALGQSFDNRCGDRVIAAEEDEQRFRLRGSRHPVANITEGRLEVGTRDRDIATINESPRRAEIDIALLKSPCPAHNLVVAARGAVADPARTEPRS